MTPLERRDIIQFCLAITTTLAGYAFSHLTVVRPLQRQNTQLQVELHNTESVLASFVMDDLDALQATASKRLAPTPQSLPPAIPESARSSVQDLIEEFKAKQPPKAEEPTGIEQ